jgi:hypothetical protein
MNFFIRNFVIRNFGIRNFVIRNFVPVPFIYPHNKVHGTFTGGGGQPEWSVSGQRARLPVATAVTAAPARGGRADR